MAENLAYLPQVCKAMRECGYWVYDYKGENIDEAKATENYKKYGVLYNYKAAQNACPEGWKLPTKEDIEILVANYKGEKKTYAALIENGSSGFSAKFGGQRQRVRVNPFQGKDKYTHFMTSTKGKAKGVYCLFLRKSSEKAIINKYAKKHGLHVRCIKE